MKKTLSLFVAIAFMLGGLALPVSAENELSAGTVLKTEGSSTLYYLGDDNKLYVFPNANTYFSWFSEFENIMIISDEKFGTYELGGNVHYKPGSLLVKTPSSLKVYAVGLNGELRWIKTEEMAQKFYGKNWNKLVDDIPDSFFTNYRFADPIEDEKDYSPEELVEQVETISHNRGWKALKKAQKRFTTRVDRHCENLKNAMNRLQERADKFGFELPDSSTEFFENCGERADWSENKKVYFCKVDENGNKQTISVSRNAMFAHLKNGAKLGKCEGDNTDEGDNGDENTVETLELSGLNEKNIGTSSATIIWTSNKSATSKLEYSLNSDLSNSSVEEMSDEVINHEILLSGLNENTIYYYVVSSETGDESASSSVRSFTTEEIDNLAPEISDVMASTTSETATITWDTDENSDSKVVFALESIASTSPSEERNNSDMVTNHSIVIDGLASSTLYYYYVESKDASGNTAKSEEYEFETLE